MDCIDTVCQLSLVREKIPLYETGMVRYGMVEVCPVQLIKTGR